MRHSSVVGEYTSRGDVGPEGGEHSSRGGVGLEPCVGPEGVQVLRHAVYIPAPCTPPLTVPAPAWTAPPLARADKCTPPHPHCPCTYLRKQPCP